MTDEELEALNDAVIVVRFDRDICRVVVDLGQVDPLGAAEMLRLAWEAVHDENDPPVVIYDGDVLVIADEEDE